MTKEQGDIADVQRAQLEQALYEKDPTYTESRKRHKLMKFTIAERIYFCFPFINGQKELIDAFMNFLEFPNT